MIHVLRRLPQARLLIAAAVLLSFTVTAAPALAQETGAGKPNILVIWGDDIGQSNISAFTNGLMGYRTPNI
ncbi:MAG: arylsulfatase, partial [Methyloceanibacter sp.]